MIKSDSEFKQQIIVSGIWDFDSLLHSLNHRNRFAQRTIGSSQTQKTRWKFTKHDERTEERFPSRVEGSSQVSETVPLTLGIWLI